ncbi:MAG: Co2+/Mg2+ efflux protein ApaG [Bacteroidia bacterium]|nr:Co2+/Mg2+ efflux protein ApaG [Bacteroidia bacterium]
MPENLASAVTNGIRVDVRTTYVEDESSPNHSYFVYLYQIEITNESEEEVQLLRREWTIVDGMAQKRLVEGDGVVGKQPVIVPGQTHRYVSGSNLPTPVGMMKGKYLMVRLSDQQQFWIDIPSFTLYVPHLDN